MYNVHAIEIIHTQTLSHLPATCIAVVALREDDSVECIVEFDIHLHARSIALYVELGDLWNDTKYVADHGKLCSWKQAKRKESLESIDQSRYASASVAWVVTM